MKRIKLLHVIHDMGPGGAERVVLNYMKNHDRRIFDPLVCILYRLFPNEKKEMEEAGINFIHLNKRRGWDPKTVLSLASIIKNEQVKILHLHNISSILYGTIAGLISIRPKIFSTEHNIVKFYSFQGRLQKNLKKVLRLFHKRIITVSDEVKKSHENHYPYFRKKYITIHNGIEESLYNKPVDIEKYRSEFGFNNENIVIGKVASMTQQKAHEIFLQAVKRVFCHEPNARFLVIGDGPRRDKLKQIVANMNLEKEIIFTGVRNDVPSLLQFMDIFVLSSAWEGFPMTIIEAMASGTPAVVTDVGGNKEAVVHGETGFLCKKGDPRSLSEAIIKLSTDKDLRSIMGGAAKKRLIENFTSKIMVRKTEKLYLENHE